jgi:membrane associated rhomboid family serine protease
MNQGSNSRSASATPYRRQEGDCIAREQFDEEYHLEDDKDDQNGIPEGEVRLLDVYEYRQKYGYLSIAISFVQTIILIVMMVECGVAPIRINPMVGPYPDALSNWGAKNAALILENGQTWRLLSPALVHAGVIHLVGNISVQLETGLFFEREWGSAIWLLIYLASTVGATIISTCFMPNVLSVGSSGAVMGIFGAKISEIFCRSCESRVSVQEKVGHAIRKHQLAEALGGAVIVMLFSFIPFVDWAAHLGGLLTGITVGLMVFSCYVEGIVWRCIWFVTGVTMTIALFTTSLTYMYNDVEPAESLRDVCAYYQEFFEGYECSCPLYAFGGSQ